VDTNVFLICQEDRDNVNISPRVHEPEVRRDELKVGRGLALLQWSSLPTPVKVPSRTTYAQFLTIIVFLTWHELRFFIDQCMHEWLAIQEMLYVCFSIVQFKESESLTPPPATAPAIWYASGTAGLPHHTVAHRPCRSYTRRRGRLSRAIECSPS
jgi:hypothetical protein